MKVKDVMKIPVMTLSTEGSVLAASRMMKENNFRHMPITNGDGNVVGVVTDRDLKRASASEATSLEVHELHYLLEKITLGEVMSNQPVVAKPDTEARHAANLMLDKHIGCLPVVEGNVLVGIITKDDLLDGFANRS